MQAADNSQRVAEDELRGPTSKTKIPGGGFMARSGMPLFRGWWLLLLSNAGLGSLSNSLPCIAAYHPMCDAKNRPKSEQYLGLWEGDHF